jgi:GNAT superfamily N-acetyltransferase
MIYAHRITLLAALAFCAAAMVVLNSCKHKKTINFESKKMIDVNKTSKWIIDITKTIPLETSGKLITKDKQNGKIILEWRLTHVKDPDFAKYMRDLRDIGVQSFVPVEVAFLKSNLDKEFQEAFCKPLEPLFKQGQKAKDWQIFKKALEKANWNIVEEKMKLIIEEFFLMDYSNFGASDLHLFVIIRDKNTNKVQGYAMFYITPEYPYGKLKMTHLGVIPEKRGLGIGKILMSSVIKIIPSTKLIFQNPRPTNENAIKAYIACGFTVDKNPVLEPRFKINSDHWIYLEYNMDSSDKLQKVAKTLNKAK